MADNIVNGVHFSLGPMGSNAGGTSWVDTEDASVDLAVRILNSPEKGMSRDLATINRKYPKAQADTALFQAYKTARHLQPTRDDVKDRSAREAPQLVAGTMNTVMYSKGME